MYTAQKVLSVFGKNYLEWNVLKHSACYLRHDRLAVKTLPWSTITCNAHTPCGQDKKMSNTLPIALKRCDGEEPTVCWNDSRRAQNYAVLEQYGV